MKNGALPTIYIPINGNKSSVLVDTGCTDNIVAAKCCSQWQRQKVDVFTMNGDRVPCCGIGQVCLEASPGRRTWVDVLVMEGRPMGHDMILGMNGISSLGGVTVRTPR